MSGEIIQLNPNASEIRRVIATQVELQRQALQDYTPVLDPSRYNPKQVLPHCMQINAVAEFVELLRSSSYHMPEEDDAFEREAGGIVNEFVTEDLIRAGWYEKDLATGENTSVLSGRYVTPIITAFYAPHAEVTNYGEAFGVEASQIKVGDGFVTNPDFLIVDEECRILQAIETSVSDSPNYWRYKKKRIRDFKTTFKEHDCVSDIVSELVGIYMMQEYAFQKHNSLLGGGEPRIPLPLPYNRKEFSAKFADLTGQPPQPKIKAPTKREVYARDKRQTRDYLRQFTRI